MSERSPGFPLWDFWGREVVKDAILLLLAVPVLVSLVYVPVVLTTGGRLVALLLVLAASVALFWVARRLLVRWVAAGDRAKGSEVTPSHD